MLPNTATVTWWRVLRRNRLVAVGVALGLVVLIAAIGAPAISPLDPSEQDAATRLSGPGSVHVMGQDTFGRDVFTRVLYAARVSLLVGVGAVALGAVLGIATGLIAGYGRGWTENVLMRGVDVLMAFPRLRSASVPPGSGF
jgi:peptide/nickel transport system permease protein